MHFYDNKRIGIVLIVLFLNLPLALSQKKELVGSNKLVKTTEKIVSYKFIKPLDPIKTVFMPIGYVGKKVVYLYKYKQDSPDEFYLFDESDGSFKSIYYNLPINRNKSYYYSVKDSFLFSSEMNFSSMEDYGFNSLNFCYSNKKITLEKIYNADKKIHSSYSSDGKFLLINTLNTLSDYYNPEDDNKIMVYSLDSLKKGIKSKNDIQCKYCSNAYLINNILFFNKSNVRDDLSDGFSWVDIYMSQSGNLKDSIPIAKYSRIRAISPDGRYILAERPFDLPNHPLVIIDVKTSKYQLLLGRNYSKASVFYSMKENKFGFDFMGRIVYVDIPKEFPFDAFQKGNKEIPNYANKEFYKKLEHSAFYD